MQSDMQCNDMRIGEVINMGSVGDGRRSMDAEYTDKVAERAGYRKKYKSNRQKQKSPVIQNNPYKGRYKKR